MYVIEFEILRLPVVALYSPRVTPAKAWVQSRVQRIKKLDSAPVFQRGKLKIAGMTVHGISNRTRLLATLPDFRCPVK